MKRKAVDELAEMTPRGTVAVECPTCPERGWYHWVDSLDARLPDGPFLCGDCEADQRIAKQTGRPVRRVKREMTRDELFQMFLKGMDGDEEKARKLTDADRPAMPYRLLAVFADTGEEVPVADPTEGLKS